MKGHFYSLFKYLWTMDYHFTYLLTYSTSKLLYVSDFLCDMYFCAYDNQLIKQLPLIVLHKLVFFVMSQIGSRLRF